MAGIQTQSKIMIEVIKLFIKHWMFDLCGKIMEKSSLLMHCNYNILLAWQLICRSFNQLWAAGSSKAKRQKKPRSKKLVAAPERGIDWSSRVGWLPKNTGCFDEIIVSFNATCS